LANLQRERIGIALHDGTRRDFAIGEDFSSTLPPQPSLNDIAGLTNTALQRRPELRALSRAALAYEKQADVARSIAYPRLDASAQDTYANPNQRFFPQKDEFNNSWQLGV